MAQNSFEAPLIARVDQYGETEQKGTLVVISGKTTVEELQRCQKEGKIEALYINFGFDSARADLKHVRQIAKEVGITLHEVHIADVASNFLKETEGNKYDIETVLCALHGIAADFALYNGFQVINILEKFQGASVLSMLPQYYFALNQQLSAIVGEGKIVVAGNYDASEASTETVDQTHQFTQKLIFSMLSGGPDSATLLNELVRRFYAKAVVEAIFINFGQPYMAQELLSARHIANVVNVRLHEINVSGISKAFVGKGEKGVGYPILRNLINGMYGIALDFVRFHNGTELHHANIREDVVNLPWLEHFFSAFAQSSISLGTQSGVSVGSEYLSVPKAEVITRASEMMGEVEIASTFSCLTSGTVGTHCGVCRSCRNRRKAFLAAGIEDRTKYLVEPEVGEVVPYEPQMLIV